MALLFITGVPGSGKSAVEQKLKILGYKTYDVDSIGAAYNKQTDAIVQIPPANVRASEWFQTHEWRLQREQIEKLSHASEDSTVFLCGTASNEEDLWDFFDQVFFLNIDEPALRQRIQNRVDNDYGQNGDELQEIIGRHKSSANKLNLPKVIPIDATQPLDVVAQAILSKAGLI